MDLTRYYRRLGSLLVRKTLYIDILIMGEDKVVTTLILRGVSESYNFQDQLGGLEVEIHSYAEGLINNENSVNRVVVIQSTDTNLNYHRLPHVDFINNYSINEYQDQDTITQLIEMVLPTTFHSLDKLSEFTDTYQLRKQILTELNDKYQEQLNLTKARAFTWLTRGIMPHPVNENLIILDTEIKHLEHLQSQRLARDNELH